MGIAEAERKVLQEADRWYRKLLKADQVLPHESALFRAVMVWRNGIATGEVPAGPRRPTMLPPPPERLYDVKESGTRRKVTTEDTTRPAPAKVQQELVEGSRQSGRSKRRSGS